MPTTQNKGYSVQSAGQNPGTWGVGAPTALNEGMIAIVDTNMAGISTFSVSASNVTLLMSDVQNCMYRFTGTLTASIVVSPSGSGSPTPASLFNGFYYFENVTSGNFTITVTTGVGSVVLPQSRRGILFVDSTNGPRIVALVALATLDPIPSGSVMPFYQNAAPAGWTIYSAVNDSALRVVSSGGGVTSGSVAYSTLFGRTATDSYTLQIADIPSHTHTVSAPVCGGSGNDDFTKAHWTSLTYYSPPGPLSVTSSSVGGGGPHSHAIDMRVQTASVILATKN